MPTDALKAMWLEGRTRFTNLIAQISDTDLQRRLPPAPNSAGFLIRHIADVELLFAKNVFGLAGVSVHAKTVIDKKDTGEWTNLEALLAYQEYAFQQLQKAIEQMHAADWSETVTTQEFGTKTKAAAIGRITTHTAYHAGQLGLILKYGV